MSNVEVSHELLHLLDGSRLSGRTEADQVQTALAIHLFQEGLVSVGKAAELARIPRVEFEWLLSDMGIPAARYGLADYEQDQQGIVEAELRGSR